MEESGSENESVREERRGSKISVEVVVACIGLSGVVIAAIIGLIGALGTPVVAEFARSLFASAPTSTATSTQTSTPTLTPSPTSADTLTSTFVPSPTPTDTSTLTPTPAPDAVVVAPVNLRSGPGTVYDIISTLRPDRVLTVMGRNDDASWLQVNTDEMQEGWVINRADLVTLNLPTGRIPIVLTPIPPAPMSPPPEPVPESPPPPPTEDIRFWADSGHVSAGACTTVYWHVSNVNAYWVDERPGMGDDGSKQVCPCSSQTYHLRAIKRDGSEVNRSVTVNVAGQCGPGLEPITPPHAPTPTPTPCSSTRLYLDGPPVNVEVQITSPRHCDTGLATGMAAAGTYSGDLTGKEIWILVYPTDGKYYPQTLDPCRQIPSEALGGHWRTTIGFGGPPQQYDVVAVVTDTDSEASQEFKQWLQRGCEIKEFPGYLRNELPGGITEMDAITVSTAS